MPSKHPKNRVRRDINAARAAELRAEGMTLQQIADELGCHWTTVGDWLTRGRQMANDREVEASARWRDEQVALMVKVQEEAMAAAARMVTQDKDGVPVDYKGAAMLGQVVNASRRIADLWGLDAPKKLDLQFDTMDEETARKILEEDDD